MIFFYK